LDNETKDRVIVTPYNYDIIFEVVHGVLLERYISAEKGSKRHWW
jgi:hypothetical protein